MLSVKMPSVVKAIHELKRLGLVVQEPYANIELTEKGSRVAKLVLNRHTLLRSFLVKLGVSGKTADRDACLMEHILSAETLDKIRIFTEQKGNK
jgi:DtxR family Mn-dependent transcriptional regulator